MNYAQMPGFGDQETWGAYEGRAGDPRDDEDDGDDWSEEWSTELRELDDDLGCAAALIRRGDVDRARNLIRVTMWALDFEWDKPIPADPDDAERYAVECEVMGAALVDAASYARRGNEIKSRLEIDTGALYFMDSLS